MLKNRKPSILAGFFGGIERIRTAVQAFAELCLATRPRCHTKCKCTTLILVSKTVYFVLYAESTTETLSTSPLIGGLILETVIVAFDILFISEKIRLRIRFATCSRSLDFIAISSLTIAFKWT